jgi:hypothetical protein
MLWWFLILAGSAGVVLFAAMAVYLRVRRHMKISNGGPGEKGQGH